MGKRMLSKALEQRLARIEARLDRLEVDSGVWLGWATATYHRQATALGGWHE